MVPSDEPPPEGRLTSSDGCYAFLVKRPKRLFTLAMMTTVAGVAACAAVLGIDERKPDLETPAETGAPDVNDVDAADAGSDAADLDAIVFDAPIIPGAVCIEASCEAAGGTCVDSVCQFECGKKGCKNAVFNCPPDSDCQIFCAEADECEGVRCIGGKSCSIECNAANTCKNAGCTSPSCTFHCKQTDTCKTGVSCDGGACSIDCEGTNSCDEVNFTASNSCSIRCLGDTTCEGGDKRASCGATPDASIYCAPKKNACKDIIPYCRGGQRCEIRCDSKEGCNRGVCCEAGVDCIIDSGTTPTQNNKCN